MTSLASCRMPEAGGRVPLRIQVDDEHATAQLSERGAETDGRRGLADATLLVGDGDHTSRLRLAGNPALLGASLHGRFLRCVRARALGLTGCPGGRPGRLGGGGSRRRGAAPGHYRAMITSGPDLSSTPCSDSPRHGRPRRRRQGCALHRRSRRADLLAEGAAPRAATTLAAGASARAKHRSTGSLDVLEPRAHHLAVAKVQALDSQFQEGDAAASRLHQPNREIRACDRHDDPWKPGSRSEIVRRPLFRGNHRRRAQTVEDVPLPDATGVPAGHQPPGTARSSSRASNSASKPARAEVRLGTRSEPRVPGCRGSTRHVSRETGPSRSS